MRGIYERDLISERERERERERASANSPLSSETESLSGVLAPQLVPVGLCAITNRPELSLATSIPELLLGMAVLTASPQVRPLSVESGVRQIDDQSEPERP